MTTILKETNTDRAGNVGQRETVRQAEVVAVVFAVVVIALLAAVDIVRNAPAAAPIAQAAVDAAPLEGWTSSKPQLDDRHDFWAADESAQGTRPEATH